MDSIVILVAVSVITEGLAEYVKMTAKMPEGSNVIYIVTAVIGVGVALLTGADIFATLGIETSVPYVGEVLTGVLCSRGSNYVYDLMSRIKPRDTEPVGVEEPHGYEEEGRG